MIQRQLLLSPQMAMGKSFLNRYFVLIILRDTTTSEATTTTLTTTSTSTTSTSTTTWTATKFVPDSTTSSGNAGYNYGNPGDQYGMLIDNNDSSVDAGNYNLNVDEDGDGIPDSQFSGLTCWTCHASSWAKCANQGKAVKCLSNEQSCFTTVRKRNWELEAVEMGCKARDVCENEKEQNFPVSLLLRNQIR